jgi:hypothetical protein
MVPGFSLDLGIVCSDLCSLDFFMLTSGAFCIFIPRGFGLSRLVQKGRRLFQNPRQDFGRKRFLSWSGLDQWPEFGLGSADLVRSQSHFYARKDGSSSFIPVDTKQDNQIGFLFAG